MQYKISKATRKRRQQNQNTAKLRNSAKSVKSTENPINKDDEKL